MRWRIASLLFDSSPRFHRLGSSPAIGFSLHTREGGLGLQAGRAFDQWVSTVRPSGWPERIRELVRHARRSW